MGGYCEENQCAVRCGDGSSRVELLCINGGTFSILCFFWSRAGSRYSGRIHSYDVQDAAIFGIGWVTDSSCKVLDNHTYFSGSCSHLDHQVVR